MGSGLSSGSGEFSHVKITAKSIALVFLKHQGMWIRQLVSFKCLHISVIIKSILSTLHIAQFYLHTFNQMQIKSI